jgi:hypothetical protein
VSGVGDQAVVRITRLAVEGRGGLDSGSEKDPSESASDNAERPHAANGGKPNSDRLRSGIRA